MLEWALDIKIWPNRKGEDRGFQGIGWGEEGFQKMKSEGSHLQHRRLILASASPRRKDLMSLTGWNVEILPVMIDERPRDGERPEDYVTRLAREKVKKASLEVKGPYLVIAADTIVIDGDQILGKPADSEQALRILQDLAGRSHLVITALAILESGADGIYEDRCKTSVPMRGYTNGEIDAYIQTGSPMDKAGAYGIQDQDFQPVQMEEMSGCYANVMGLPLCHLTRTMRTIGLHPLTEVPAVCQEFTEYQCRVFPEILDL